jgi:phosphohistidine phosphatase
LRTLDDLSPGASPSDVLAAADWPNSKAAIVVVGHQPTLGLLASELLTGQTLEWSLKKGGLWWLSLRENDGDERVVLRAVINPDLA